MTVLLKWYRLDKAEYWYSYLRTWHEDIRVSGGIVLLILSFGTGERSVDSFRFLPLNHRGKRPPYAPEFFYTFRKRYKYPGLDRESNHSSSGDQLVDKSLFRLGYTESLTYLDISVTPLHKTETLKSHIFWMLRHGGWSVAPEASMDRGALVLHSRADQDVLGCLTLHTKRYDPSLPLCTA